MFGFGGQQPANSPFAQSSPPAFGTGTAPSFGATNPTQPTFGTSSFGTPTPSFGSTSSVFGTPAPFGTSSPGVQSSTMFSSPASSANPFGGSTPASSANPFGGSTPASSSNPFGGSTPASSANPFGGSTPASSSNPFGGSTPTSSANPFGGSSFAAAQASMDDDDMSQAQTPTFPTTSSFPTASSFTPTSTFPTTSSFPTASAFPTASTFATTSGFGSSTQGFAPDLPPAMPLFGKSDTFGSSSFGKRPDTPMNDSPVFGKSQTSASLFGKTPFGDNASTTTKREPLQTFTSREPLQGFGNREPMPILSAKAAPTLFGKPASTTATDAGSTGQEPTYPLFVPSRSPEKSLFAKTAAEEKPSVAAAPHKRSLFGKAIASATLPDEKRFKEEGHSTSESIGVQKSLFGKPSQSDSSGLFGKSPPSSGSALFGKTAQSESSLFGKSAQSDSSALFGQRDDTPDPQSSYGQIKMEPGLFTRTIKNESSETAIETQFEPSESFVPESSQLFGGVAKRESSAGGLFGKASSSFAGKAETPASKIEAEARRPSNKPLFGKTSLSTEAARRSVKKSMNLQRQISALDEAHGSKDPTAPKVAQPLAYKADDIVKRVAIVVENIPVKQNNRDTLQTFFHKFGIVKKVYCNLRSRRATVHFSDHESAARAMRRGATLASGVRVVWSTYTAPKKAPSARAVAEPSTSYDADASRSIDPDRSYGAGPDRVCRTTKEKADYLNELEKRMRLDRTKETRLDRAVAIVGSCMDMCPERERYIREEQRRLHPFETFKTDDKTRGAPLYVDHARAVKEYSRSSADQDEPLPLELRPPPVLAKTMEYLITRVIDKGDDSNWTEWFDFLWNRTRAIRKDITQQHLCDLTAVDLLEKCTRFHIFCGVRLCELGMMEFDQKINSENLTKCLQSLKELYHDLKVRQSVECPNEAEFRAYMVLMKLNEGDILREVQTYPHALRRSRPVRFATDVHLALGSNNYVKFFKLVRRATFLDACLMFRYFTQVRVAALLRIMKAFNFKGGLQYPVRYLYRQLGFESEDETVSFCEDHGLEETRDTIVMERNMFVEPEAGSSIVRRPKLLIESKQEGSLGEIVQGGPLPDDVTMLEPTFSFDSEGRYRGGYGQQALPGPALVKWETPAATSSPSPSSDTTSGKGFMGSPIRSLVPPVAQVAQVAQPAVRQQHTNEEVKTCAKELFLEVIDEIVPEMCRSLLNSAHMAERMTRQCTDMVVQEQVITMAREVCEETILEERRNLRDQEARRLEQLERECRRIEEDRRRDEISALICDEVLEDVLNGLRRSTALVVYCEAKEELRQKQLDEVAETIRDDLVRQTTDDLVEALADDMDEYCARKRMLNRLHEEMLTCRRQKLFRAWLGRYRRRVRQKNTMENFPICPSMANETELVAALVPAGREPGVRQNAFYVTANARLTTEPADKLERRRKELDLKLSAATRVAELRREVSWKPLDLVTVVARAVEKEMNDTRVVETRPFIEMDVYWKLLVVLPDLHEDDDTTLSDWVCQKLRKGFVPDCERDKTELLSLYSRASPLEDGRSARVHVCVRTVQQSALIDTELDVLSGTGAVLVVASSDSSERDVFELTNDVMCDLNDAKGIPVAILSRQEADILDAQKQKLMTTITVGDRIEDKEASVQLCQGLSWLLEHRPSQPSLKRTPIRKFVDDFLSKEFFVPVFTNLNERRKRGLLHQPPRVLLALYQSTVNHLAEVASSASYVRQLWPAPEFVRENSGLPEYGWNSAEHLQYLAEALLSLSLPDFHCLDAESETWARACTDVWDYVGQVVSQESEPTQLCSRIEQCIVRARRDFEETCYLSEQLANCQPLYVNMPWTEIVVAVIDHQLSSLDWTDPIYEETEYPVELNVVYEPALLRGFKAPGQWTMALTMPDRRLLQVTANAKDTVARSAKRKLEATAEYDSPDTKRSYIVDTSIDDRPQTHRTRADVLDLQSRVAYEKQANDRMLEYMERSIMEHDSYLSTGATSFISPMKAGISSRSFTSPARSAAFSPFFSKSTCGGPTSFSAENESRIRNVESTLDITSCLPEDLRARVDSILGEKRLNESMLELRQKMADEERAADIFEMKVNLMLNEPPPVMMERTELNVLSRLGSSKLGRP